MTIEERMKACLDKIEEMKATSTGSSEELLGAAATAYTEGVNSI